MVSSCFWSLSPHGSRDGKVVNGYASFEGRIYEKIIYPKREAFTSSLP